LSSRQPIVIEAAFRHFSRYVPLGAPREQVKELLRAERAAFKERCCFEPNGLPANHKTA
jgi:hypothetical protein